MENKGDKKTRWGRRGDDADAGGDDHAMRRRSASALWRQNTIKLREQGEKKVSDVAEWLALVVRRRQWVWAVTGVRGQ